MKTARLAGLALGLTVASITASAEPEIANRSDSERATQALSGDRDSYSWRDLSGRRFNFTDGSQIRGDRIHGDWDRAPSRSAAAVATPSAVAAPEIDPAAAASGFTLLLGGIAVLLARRRRG
ncbi:MAG TPA: hypothetical protein VII35_16095 [Steroidobacteraceae bacterium]